MDKIMEVLFPEETQRRKEGKCPFCGETINKIILKMISPGENLKLAECVKNARMTFSQVVWND